MKMRELESKSFTIWRSNEKKMKIKGKRDGRSLGPPLVYILHAFGLAFLPMLQMAILSPTRRSNVADYSSTTPLSHL